MKRHFPSAVTRSLGLMPILLAFAAPTFAAESDKKKLDPALDIYFNANGLYNDGLYELAIDEYIKFLNKYPKHPKTLRARHGLSLSYFNTKQYDKAEPILAKLAVNKDFSQRTSVQNLRGHCLLRLKKYADAESAFQWVVKNAKSPSAKTNALIGQTEALYQQAKWKQVAEVAETTAKTLGSTSRYTKRILFQAALARYELKQYDQAAKTLRPFTQTTKPDAYTQHAVFLLAECHRNQNNLAEAASAYKLAAEKLTGRFTPEARYRLGYVYFLQDKHTDAMNTLSDFKRKHKDSPLIPRADLFIARSNLARKNYNNAIATLRKLRSNPKIAPEATLWLSRTYLQQKNHGNVTKLLGPALAKYKDNPLYSDLLYDHATALMHQSKFSSAAENFAKSAAAAPKRDAAANAQFLEIHCLHRAADYKSSLSKSESFLKANPNHGSAPEVAFLRAENLFLLDQSSAALPAFTNFLKANPKHNYANVARLRIAESHYKAKNWKNTVTALTQLAAKTPADPAFAQIHFILGDAQFRLDNHDAASKAFARFIATQPKAENIDAARLNLALAYEKLNKRSDARKQLNDLISKNPKSDHLPAARVELARLHLLQKQYPQARAALANLKPSKNSPLVDFLHAHIALGQSKDDKAITHFTAFINQFPSNKLTPPATLELAKIHIRKSSFSLAEKALTPLVKSAAANPNPAESIFYLGLAQARQKKFNPASKNFQTVFTKYPTSDLAPRALYELAWCDKSLKKTADATKRYTTLLTKFPRDPIALDAAFELAELEFEAKKYSDAIKRLSRLNAAVAKLTASKRTDLKANILYRLGWNHFNKGDNLEAAKFFSKMISDHPKSPKRAMASYQAGEAFLNLNEYESAYKHFARATKLKDDTLKERALFRRGETEALIDKFAESEKTFQSFLTFFTKSDYKKRAQFGLGWALENQKKYEAAIKVYQTVISSGSRDETTARCQLQIGVCYYSLKKYDDAVKELNKVRVNFAYPKWKANAILQMADALEASGKGDRAKTLLKELVEKFPKTTAAATARSKLAKLDS